MKAAFITFFTPTTGGGDAKIAYEIPPAFADNGHSALLIHPAESSHNSFQGNLTTYTVESQTKNNIVIPKISGTTIKNIFDQLDQFQPDVIHAQDPGPLSLIGQLWAQENQVPFFLTLHILPTKIKSFGAQEVSPFLDKLFDSQLFLNYFDNFLKNCQAVITLNEEARQDLEKFGYEGKTFIIPNGRNLAKYQQLSPPPLKQKPINLIFVGFLSQRKNQLFLLKALKHLSGKKKQFHLHLVGEPLEKNYTNKLKQYCRENNLDNVQFWGRVKHKKVVKLLGKSHIFVSASTMEVQSLVILEALAAGKPIVALANETTRQLIDDQVGRLLPPNATPKKFAQSIKQISQMEKASYQTMSKTAQQRVARFDWPKVITKTVRAYQEVINNDATPKPADWQDIFSARPVSLKELLPKARLSYQWLALIPLMTASFIGRQIIQLSKLE